MRLPMKTPAFRSMPTRFLGLLVLVMLTWALVGCSPPAPTAEAVPETQAPETEEVQAETPAEEPVEPAAEEPPVEEEAQPEAEAAPEPVALSEFVLDGEGTEARFILEETLAGVHTVVTGITSAVTGSLMASPEDLAATRIEPIVIDSSSFVTDNSMRNNAIRRFILESTQYPEIVFTPTAIQGVPASAAIGETFDLEIVGLFRVRGTEAELTFPITAQFASDAEITGSGAVTIVLDDYGIEVFMPPRVTWVADEMILELDFRAVAAPK